MLVLLYEGIVQRVFEYDFHQHQEEVCRDLRVF